MTKGKHLNSAERLWRAGPPALLRKAKRAGRIPNTEGHDIFTQGITIAENIGWHHVVGTYDKSYLKLYVDGVLEGSAAEILQHYKSGR